MESIVLYSLVFTAVALMLVGIYGAMPLFVEAEASASGPQPLSVARATMAPAIIPERSRPVAEIDGAALTSTDTESILTGLHAEVDLLRGEIEHLRGELSRLLEAPQPKRAARSRADVPQPLRSEVNASRKSRALARA